MTVIWLSGKDILPEQFQNYEGIFEYIRDREDLKFFEDHPQFARTAWSFIVLSPERLRQHRKALEKIYDAGILLKAFARQLSIIEICEGDYTRPRQILLASEVNIGKLKEDWCRAYCKVHEISIIET